MGCVARKVYFFRGTEALARARYKRTSGSSNSEGREKIIIHDYNLHSVNRSRLRYCIQNYKMKINAMIDEMKNFKVKRFESHATLILQIHQQTHSNPSLHPNLVQNSASSISRLLKCSTDITDNNIHAVQVPARPWLLQPGSAGVAWALVATPRHRQTLADRTPRGPSACDCDGG